MNLGRVENNNIEAVIALVLVIVIILLIATAVVLIVFGLWWCYPVKFAVIFTAPKSDNKLTNACLAFRVSCINLSK